MVPQNDEHLGESADENGTTTHTPHILPAIEEESSEVDETGATHHQSLMMQEDDIAADIAAEEEAYAKQQQLDQDIRLHKKIAHIAAKAYNRACERSNVLSKHNALNGIAEVRIEELEIGKFLGKGSFSNVHEITSIACDGYGMVASSNGGGKKGGHGDDDDDDDNHSWDGLEGSDRNTAAASNVSKVAGSGVKALQSKTSSVKVDNPRRLLAEQFRRHESGTYRYAIKFLRDELRAKPQKYAVGTADLVVEGMFLASLSHPNIVKIRGLPQGGVKYLVKGNRDYGYFLIMDRLFDTLSERIYGDWVDNHPMKVRKKFFLKNKQDQQDRNESLAVRLKVALDMSAALQFLHSKNIIYRDLKPENLGFDVRGDIKLFDFGLVRELREDEKDRNGNFRLSMAGTPRYMAPECGMYQPYNLSADVYSFSMLLWEMLTLTKPMKAYTYTKLKNEIFVMGERPPIQKVFNKKMRRLIDFGWHQNPGVRPSMREIFQEIKEEFMRIAPDEARKVTHGRRRSTYVAQQINALTPKQLMRLNTQASDIK